MTTPSIDELAKAAELAQWLKKTSQAIYLACEETVADDISPKLIQTADLILSLSSRVEKARREALEEAAEWFVQTFKTDALFYPNEIATYLRNLIPGDKP